MKVLIIEDESLAADRLEEMIMEINPEITISAKIKSVKDSVRWLMKNKADLIFLDIQLSDGLSFNIFNQISVETPIIFTTAYDQYAINAFKVNSISYLLKPIRKSELEESLTKYRNMAHAFQPDIESLIDTFEGKRPKYKERFLIKIGERLRKIEVSEIAYFYVEKNGAYLKTFQNKDLPIDYTLDSIDSQLDPEKFFRINRKYIINMESIQNMTAWSRSRIKLELNPPTGDDMNTIVSIDRSTDFKNWLND